MSIAEFAATIFFLTILAAALVTTVLAVRSEWPLFLSAYGFNPPRARNCPPAGTPVRSVTVRRGVTATTPPAVEPAGEGECAL